MVDGVADFGGEVEEGEGAEDGAGHCGVGGSMEMLCEWEVHNGVTVQLN